MDEYRDIRRISEVIKLIATDMDGTLLNSKGQMPLEFGDVFERLKEKGVIFAVASGRQYATLATNFKQFHDDMLFIAENGTYVVYKGEELAFHPLDKAVARQLITKAHSIQDTYIVVSTKNGAYIENNDPRFLKEVAKYYVKCQYVEDLLEIEEDILKIAICDFQGVEKNSYEAFKPFQTKALICVAGDIWLDMMAIGVNKGEAIRTIQDKLGFTYEQTMVFGDYLNDYEMLQSAYHSYAMQNAHPRLKEVARFIAKSNDDNGVMEKIKEIVVGKEDEKQENYIS